MDDLTGFKTLIAVVDAGSFTAGAERLGISKKLASKYIAALEARLGVRLLHRTTRSLSLTSAGQQLYPRAAALLEDFDAMTSDIRSAEKGLSGTLRISAPVSFGETYVQAALLDFQITHPDVTIDLRLNDRFVDVAGEGFDLAVRIGRLEDSGLIARRLGETTLLAVAAPEYLAQNGTPETPKDLIQHNCIRDSNLRSGQSWPFEVNGAEQRIAVQGDFMVNSATAVRALVVGGRGIGLCPDWAVAQDLASGRLLRLPFDHPSAHLGVYAVFTDARQLPARTRAVLDHLVQAFKVPPWQVA